MEVVNYLERVDIWPVVFVLISWLIAIGTGFAYKHIRWHYIYQNTKNESVEEKAAWIKKELYLVQLSKTALMVLLMLCLPLFKGLLAFIIEMHVKVYNNIFN